MSTFQNLLQFQIVGNTGKDYLIALGIFVGAMIVLKIFQSVVLSRLKKAAKKTKTDLDDVLIEIVEKIRPPFYLFIALYVGLKTLLLPVLADQIIYGLFILIIVFQIIRSLQIFIDYWTEKLIRRKEEAEDSAESSQNKATVKSISYFLKLLLWVLAVFIILSNWGINITSLIAGLGIGGLAIAFALQNILQDVFSSFSIMIDKPFKVGDFIIVDNDMGVVQKIGIKTTRIKTLQGQELVFPNRQLTDTRINNYKKMEKRRIVFSFGVLYETSTEKVKKIPEIVKDIIDKEPNAELDRVHFKEFGDFSLNFEVVYYVTVPDYGKYMDTQQSINFTLKEEFEKEGIEFAYPTQTLFVKK
ncbi:MAG: mechanosensitive ion channel family protein [Candidatus Paceibacterota bacterium]